MSHTWVLLWVDMCLTAKYWMQTEEKTYEERVAKTKTILKELLSSTWKGGGFWSVSTARKGGEKDREREREGWLGGCVSVWVREAERRRSSADTHTDLWHCLESRLWWGHPVEVHSWGSQRQRGSRTEQRRSRDTFWTCPWSDCPWPPPDSHTPNTHRHALASCLAHQPHNRLFCPVRSQGFSWLRWKGGKK